MYSDKLKTLKIRGLSKDENGEVRHGIEIGHSYIEKMLDGFCKRKDAIGVPVTDFLNLFDDYCKENQLLLVNHLTVGRIMKSHFNLTRKKVRRGEKLIWVYVADEEF